MVGGSEAPGLASPPTLRTYRSAYQSNEVDYAPIFAACSRATSASRRCASRCAGVSIVGMAEIAEQHLIGWPTMLTPAQREAQRRDAEVAREHAAKMGA